MEHNKASLKLIVLLFVFSLVFTNVVIAVPWSRSLKTISASLSPQDLQDKKLAQGQFEEVYGSSFTIGRMDLEVNDYGGTGANPNHDPKPPGRD